MKGKKFPDTVRATAVALAETTNPTAASRTLSLPEPTIRRWVTQWREGELDDGQLQEEIDRLVAEFTAEARAEMSEAISKAAMLMRRELDRYLERGEDAPPLKPSELRDLSICLGVLTDKLQILNGQPGSISARFSYSLEEHANTHVTLAPPPMFQGEG